jgi:hypothetical protein
MAAAVMAGDLAAMPAVRRGSIPAADAFAVHRGTVFGVLCNALRLSFPTIDALVGDAFFDQAATAYVAEQPPRRARLSAYGDGFPGFLETYPPAQDLPYLGDVARLDLAVGRALAAPGAEVRRQFAIDAAVSLALPVSLTALSLSFPADLIRAGLDAGDDQQLGAIDLAPRPRVVAVWRAGRQAVVRPLGPAAGVFLTEVLGGASADEALAAVFASHPPQAALPSIQTEVFAAPFAQIIQTRFED